VRKNTTPVRVSGHQEWARLGARSLLPPLPRCVRRIWNVGWGKRDWVEHDPDYDILRDEPRFKKLRSRLK